MPESPVSSSTFSSKRWLQIFFLLVGTVVIGFVIASEWMVRAYVLPQDNFEWIAKRLRNSTQPNAAFGDSHVAAVPAYNTKDFVNLGIGATTIKRMDQRVRYYFSKINPGEVIIQADPHLFADYRLEAPGSYVPEDYSDSRLRILDPQHRGFMLRYWTMLLTSRGLKERESTANDQLWQTANEFEKETAAPQEPPEKVDGGALAGLDALPQKTRKPSAHRANEPTATPGASAGSPAMTYGETLAKFNAFMDDEVSAHTPAPNFREREQAGVYKDMIKFLISRGAKVCLVNYPVDRNYRERADAIPAFAKVRKFYEEIAQENHIPYVSFWSRFDDPSMFQNTDHVNQNGSPILAREARQACFGKSGSS
jgi:hypothetical protein